METSVIRVKVKVKVKVTLEEATKTQKGSRGIASSLSLTSGLDGVVGQRHAPAGLTPGKTRYPLYRRLGGDPWSVWTGVENLAPPTGIRSPDRPARSGSLYQLSYPGPKLLFYRM
jgi:hypothetical protein